MEVAREEVFSELQYVKMKGKVSLVEGEVEEWRRERLGQKKEELDRLAKLSTIVELLTAEIGDLKSQNEKLSSSLASEAEQWRLEQTTLRSKKGEAERKGVDERADAEQRVKDLRIQLAVKNNVAQEKKSLEGQIARHTEEIKKAREDNMALYASKERAKVKAKEELRKEMALKLAEAQSSLSAMKEKELSSATRLSILQNFQLSWELEHQSREIERLLSESKSLQLKTEEYFSLTEVHKVVHVNFSKKCEANQLAILKLSTENERLELQLELLRKKSTVPRPLAPLPPTKAKTPPSPAELRRLKTKLTTSERTKVRLGRKLKILLDVFFRENARVVDGWAIRARECKSKMEMELMDCSWDSEEAVLLDDRSNPLMDHLLTVALFPWLRNTQLRVLAAKQKLSVDLKKVTLPKLPPRISFPTSSKCSPKS